MSCAAYETLSKLYVCMWYNKKRTEVYFDILSLQLGAREDRVKKISAFQTLDSTSDTAAWGDWQVLFPGIVLQKKYRPIISYTWCSKQTCYLPTKIILLQILLILEACLDLQESLLTEFYIQYPIFFCALIYILSVLYYLHIYLEL